MIPAKLLQQLFSVAFKRDMFKKDHLTKTTSICKHLKTFCKNCCVMNRLTVSPPNSHKPSSNQKFVHPSIFSMHFTPVPKCPQKLL